jgi:hypothetical protein
MRIGGDSMPVRYALLIATALACIVAGLVEWRLLSGYRRVKGALLRKLRPEIAKRYWVLFIPATGIALVAYVGFQWILFGLLGPSELPVHLVGVAFALLMLGDLLAAQFLGVYPLPTFRARFILQPIPKATFRALLAMRAAFVSLVWITALVWFRG